MTKTIRITIEAEFELDPDNYPKDWNPERCLECEIKSTEDKPGEFLSCITLPIKVTGQIVGITKEAIKAFRKLKKMNRPEFGDYMGVSAATVRSWEDSPGIPPKWLLDDERTKHLAN